MNGIVSRMIDTQLLLFLYMLCGVIISKIGILREDNRQPVVRLLMDVAMPMMVLSAFNKPTSLDEIKASLLVMLIALLGLPDHHSGAQGKAQLPAVRHRGGGLHHHRFCRLPHRADPDAAPRPHRSADRILIE